MNNPTKYMTNEVMSKIFAFPDTSIKEEKSVNNVDINYQIIQDINQTNHSKESEKFDDKKQQEDEEQKIEDRKTAEKKEVEENVQKDEKMKKKIGRIPKNVKSIISQNKGEYHDKYKTDNIMKKIKVHCFKYVVINANLIIKNNKLPKKKYNLKKLSYSHINVTNREKNLELFNMKLQDLLSLDISAKYKCKSDKNKDIIKKLLKNENNKAINYFLNLSFKEWIYYFRKNMELNIEGIIIKFEGYNELIEKIKKDNQEENYIKVFEECFSNIVDWYTEKTPRKAKKRNTSG